MSKVALGLALAGGRSAIASAFWLVLIALAVVLLFPPVWQLL